MSNQALRPGGAGAVAGQPPLAVLPVTPHANTHAPATGSDALATAAAGTIAVGDAAATGTGDAFARNDHRHALPAPGLPAAQVPGAGAAGASTKVAREDHVHPWSGVAFPVAHAATHAPATGTDPLATAAAGTIAVGDAAATGTGDAFARNDHRHALPAPGLPAAQVAGAGSAGVSTKVAREDHVHPMAASASAAIIFLGGASMGAGDVGKHFGAQDNSNGGKAAVLSSDNQMASGIAGTIVWLTWASAAADATTVFKIVKNGLVVATLMLTGTSGRLPVAVAVAGGDLVAVEYDAGTPPGRTTVQVWAAS